MKIEGYEIEFLGHSGFLVKMKNKVIIIDPYRVSDSVPKADIVLVTHSHNDHCSIRANKNASPPSGFGRNHL
jgi:L-ascorbate metabolism protein UlaG (beta-lactamase superfamily)